MKLANLSFSLKFQFESVLSTCIALQTFIARKYNVCKIYFHNKALDFINLSHILNDSELEGTIPIDARDFPIPTVVYNLPPPIRSKIFNFNKFIEDLDLINS